MNRPPDRPQSSYRKACVGSKSSQLLNKFLFLKKRSFLCGWEVRRGGVHFFNPIPAPQSKISYLLVNFLEAAQFSL